MPDMLNAAQAAEFEEKGFTYARALFSAATAIRSVANRCYWSRCRSIAWSRRRISATLPTPTSNA